MTHRRGGTCRIFFSTTDQSGDEHAAALIAEIRRLRPDAEFAGLGGPRMAAAGCRLVAETTRRSAMWFDAFREIGRMWRILQHTTRFWAAWRPDVFVPIDSPGINFPLARRARSRGITNIYYIPPQIWAWGRWRLRKLRRLFERLLVALPFEESFYRDRGFDVEYVGHPLFDYVPRKTLSADLRGELEVAPDETLIGLLPGSRRTEVQRHMPMLRDAARLIGERHANARFAVGAAGPGVLPIIEEILAGSDLNVPVLLDRTLELMRDARLCLVASGTATLQLLHFATPMVIVYRLNGLEWHIMRLLKRSRYVGLVNVLAHRAGMHRNNRGHKPTMCVSGFPEPLVPELVTRRDRPEWVAENALPLLEDSPERRATVEALRALRAEVDHPGAVRHAAEAILCAATRAGGTGGAPASGVSLSRPGRRVGGTLADKPPVAPRA